MGKDDKPMNEHEEKILMQQAERAWGILEDRAPLGSGNEYIPNRSDAELVMVYKAIGRPKERIAAKLGIGITTLDKYYGEVMADAKALLKEDYDVGAWIMAKRGLYDSAYQPSTKWFGATQFGYSEKQQIDNVSSDGSMSPMDKPILVMPDAGMIKNGGVMEEKTAENDGSMPEEFLSDANKDKDKDGK